jgi:hypothetical protein
MNFECGRLEEALREDDAGLLALAREHAATCANCRVELKRWDALSAAARQLHHEWESPDLWSRIDTALAAQPQRRRWVDFLGFSWRFPAWQLAATTAAVLMVMTASVWLLVRPEPRKTVTVASRDFLTEQALKDVQDSEAAYVRSVDRLAALAKPALDNEPSPLMASYREKLTVLDAAIADLKDNRDRNQLNASLSVELLSLYQEKQQTLREVLHYASQSN